MSAGVTSAGSGEALVDAEVVVGAALVTEEDVGAP